MRKTNSERHPHLLYGFDEKPPIFQLIILGLQYIFPNMISLLFAVIIINSLKLPNPLAENILSITLIAMALVNLLQFLKVGGRLIFPPSVAPPYLAPSLLAAKIGGLSLVLGMTFMAGLVQCFFSYLIAFVRRIIPEEVAALILLLIGFELGFYGFSFYVQHLPHFYNMKLPALEQFFVYVPLLFLIILDQLFGKRVQLYGIVIMVLVCYLLFLLMGYAPEQGMVAVKHAAWFYLPAFSFAHFKFSWQLTVPFMLAAFICLIKVVGSVFAMQELQARVWHGPDMKQISRASFVDGLGTVFAGLFGSFGMNVSSSSVALSLSTGITSRFIGVVVCVLLLFLAFIPKFALILLYMPYPIVAAILIEMGVKLISSSVLILSASLKRFSVALYIGVALVFGLSYGVYPEIYHQIPGVLQMLLGSTIVTAVVVALLLHYFLILFRVKKKDLDKE